MFVAATTSVKNDFAGRDVLNRIKCCRAELFFFTESISVVIQPFSILSSSSDPFLNAAYMNTASNIDTAINTPMINAFMCRLLSGMVLVTGFSCD